MQIQLTPVQLADTIELLDEIRHRLQVEAAALAGLGGETARELALKQLKSAATAWELFNHFAQF